MAASNQGTSQFYIPESRQTFINKVQAGLVQNKIVVMEGPTGVGKTVVLEEILTQTLADANKCYLTPTRGLNDIQIRSRIIEQLFGNVLFDPEMPLVTSFIEFNQPQQILIAIDNCQFLSGRIVGELLQLFSEAKNLGIELTIVLALDKSMNSTLLNVNSKLVKVMPVPLLNKQESYQLLVEYIADIPAQTNSKVKRWIDNCGGLPIQLLAYGRDQAGQVEQERSSVLNIKLWGSLLLLASLLLALGVYVYRKGLQPPITEQSTTESVTAQIEPNAAVVKPWQGSAAKQTEQTEQVTAADTETKSEFQIEERPMAQVVAMPTASRESILADILGEGQSTVVKSKKPLTTNQVEQNPTTDLILSELTKAVDDSPVNDTQVKEEPSKVSSEPKVTAPVLDKETTSDNIGSASTDQALANDTSNETETQQTSAPAYFIDNQTFMSLPADHFVLQLTAVSSEVVLSEYLASAPVSIDELNIYRIKRKKSDWIVVTYGLFETIEQARQAAVTIEANAWAKSISVIQQQILAFQKAQE